MKCAWRGWGGQQEGGIPLHCIRDMQKYRAPRISKNIFQYKLMATIFSDLVHERNAEKGKILSESRLRSSSPRAKELLMNSRTSPRSKAHHTQAGTLTL